MRIHADDKGADVERGPLSAGNPVTLDGHQLCNGFLREFLVNLRNAETLVRDIQTGHVLFGTEQKNAAVHGTVCLHAFKHGLSIMQAHGGGLQLNRPIGDDARIMPALPEIIVHHEHVIGKNPTKGQRIAGSRLFLRILRQFHSDFLHNGMPSFFLGTESRLFFLFPIVASFFLQCKA